MTNRIIARLEDVDATWLTTVLIKAGALVEGEVTRVDHERLEGNWSSNAFLTLRYSKDALGECPCGQKTHQPKDINILASIAPEPMPFALRQI